MSQSRDPLRQFLASLPPGVWLRVIGAVLVLSLLAVFGLVFLVGGVVALAAWAMVNRFLGKPAPFAPPGAPRVIETDYVVLDTRDPDRHDRR